MNVLKKFLRKIASIFGKVSNILEKSKGHFKEILILEESEGRLRRNFDKKVKRYLRETL